MDWKVLAAVLLGAGILVSAVFGSGAVENLRGMLKERLGGVFSVEANSSVPFSGTLSMDSLSFSGPATSAVIEVRSGSVLEIGGERFSFSDPSNVTLIDFSGRGSLTATNVSLDATVSSVLVNGIRVTPKSQGNIRVRGTATIISANFNNLRFRGFEKQARGNLSAWGEVTVLVRGDTVRVKDFYGDLEVRGSFSFSGLASGIEVTGTKRVVIS